MARLITDNDCKPKARFGSAAPIMEYCGAWRKAKAMDLNEPARAELESIRLNPFKVRLVDVSPHDIVRMRTRVNTLAGV